MPIPQLRWRVKASLAIASASLFVAGLALYGSTVLASSTMTLKPTADGYVQSSAATTSFGSSDQLRVDGKPTVRTYLRFDLNGVSGVSSAKLKLFAESSSGIGYKVSRTDGKSFTDSNLTWNSKPGVGSSIGNSSTFSANAWTQVDVTSAVKAAGGSVEFAVDARNSTAIKFASSEASGSHAPELVLTVSGGGTSRPTPSPTATPTGSSRPTSSPTTGPTSTPTAKPSSTPTAKPSSTPTSGPSSTPTSTSSATPVTGGFEIIAGGDTRTNVAGITATAAIIGAHPGDPVLDVGDDTADGSTASYSSFFNPTWGKYKSRIHPVPGNHEYNTAGAAGYFAYWGAQAGTKPNGWYSFDLANNWHVVALNALVNHAAGSPQELWLKSDLAAHAGMHIIAFWHFPRYTSSSAHSNDTSVTPFWNDLLAAHADLVFNGDSHQYERFGLQNASGQADPNGIRQFTTGLGGAPIYGWGTIQPNSQVRYNGSWGLLVLNLGAHSYSWQFVPVAGHTFSDTGTQATHS